MEGGSQREEKHGGRVGRREGWAVDGGWTFFLPLFSGFLFTERHTRWLRIHPAIPVDVWGRPQSFLLPEASLLPCTLRLSSAVLRRKGHMNPVPWASPRISVLEP